MAQDPDFELARRILPAGLLRALSHLFLGNKRGAMLVGGTALAGFYAGHRRSDAVFETISALKAELQEAFSDCLEELPIPPLGRLVRKGMKRR